MSLKVKYISYGKYETGGYKHELFFAQQLTQFLTTENEKCELIIERPNRFFENPFAYVRLFLLGLKANGNYNIVVARVAVFAVLRNLVTKNKVYIVLHNFDEEDGKSIWLKWYYHLLYFLHRNLPSKNISIVAVAPFWVNYFKNKINNNIQVYLFPNFFDNTYYENNRVLTLMPEQKSNRQIHLGQWSFKNHPDVFEVAKQLTSKGYYCYFSTNFKDFAKKTNDYEVVYFEHFEDYLTQMAESEFTLALTAINEGWNRVAHESILVGTPVIAYAKAGLLDLVNESKSYAATNIADVIQAIENKNVQANPSLLAHYNIKNAYDYLKNIQI
ncbi:MAG: hypothetical protein ACOVSR_05075 [Bacteroidia bacterium]